MQRHHATFLFSYLARRIRMNMLGDGVFDAREA